MSAHRLTQPYSSRHKTPRVSGHRPHTLRGRVTDRLHVIPAHMCDLAPACLSVCLCVRERSPEGAAGVCPARSCLSDGGASEGGGDVPRPQSHHKHAPVSQTEIDARFFGRLFNSSGRPAPGPHNGVCGARRLGP